MDVKYGEKIYHIEHNMDCLFFKALLEEGVDTIELNLFEDVFIKIVNNDLDFNQIDDIDHIYEGLTYFGSKKK